MDDFHVRSQFHEIISNPCFSTFRRLPPKTTSFDAAEQAFSTHEKSANYRTLPTLGLPDVAHIRSDNSRQPERVAVRYHQGTPLLHLRLSALDMPSPATIVEEIKSRPQSEWEPELPQPSYHQASNSALRDSSGSTPSFYVPFELVSAPRRMLSQRSARAQLCQAAIPATSGESPYPDSTSAVEPQDVCRMQSMKSIPDSLQAVQDLAGQFPGTPTTALKDENTLPTLSVVPNEAQLIPQAFGSPSELQSKGPPPFHEGFVLSDDSEWSSARSSPVALSDNKSMRSTRVTRQPTLYNVTGTPLRSASLYSEKPFDPFNDDDEGDSLLSFRTATGDSATALNTGKSRQSQPRKHRSPKAISKNDIPLSEVRSIGEDPRKSSTSLPRHSSPKRGNVQLKDIIIPPRRTDMPEIFDEYAESTSTGRRDSK